MTNFSGDYETFFAISEELPELNDKAIQSTGRQNFLLRKVADNAVARLEQLASSEDVQRGFRSLLQPYADEIAAIDGLQHYVDLGLLEQDDLEVQKQSVNAEVHDDKRRSLAADYSGGYALFGNQPTLEGIDYTSASLVNPDDGDTYETETTFQLTEWTSPVTDDVQINIAEPPVIFELPSSPEFSAPEPIDLTPVIDEVYDRPLKPLTVTQKGYVLHVGELGDTTLLYDETDYKQTDYSKYRLDIFGTLADNSGNSLSRAEILARSFPQESMPDKIWKNTRSWLDGVIYDDAPIVSRAGWARGAKLGILGHHVTLQRDSNIFSSTPTEVPLEPVQIDDIEATSSPALTDLSLRKYLDTVQTDNGYPLNISESAILAKLLSRSNKQLASSGLPVIESAVADDLSDLVAKSDTNCLQDYTNLQTARVEIIEEIQAFFTDEPIALASISQMDQTDPRYPFMDYLYNLGGAGRWNLYRELADAVPGLNYNVRYPHRMAAPEISDIQATIDLALPISVLKKNIQQTKPANGDHGPETSEEYPTEQPVKTEMAEVEVTVREVNPELAIELQNFSSLAREWVDEIHDRGLVDKATGFIRSQWPWLTPRLIGNSSSRIKISKSQLNLSAMDLLKLRAEHEVPQAMRIRSSSSKLSRATIDRALQLALQEYKDNQIKD